MNPLLIIASYQR